MYEDIDFCDDDTSASSAMFTHDYVQDDGYACIDIDDSCLSLPPSSKIPPHLHKNRSIPTISDETDLPK